MQMGPQHQRCRARVQGDYPDQPIQKGLANNKAIRDLIQQLGDDSIEKREDVATGKELRRMTGQSPQHFEYAVFTPDGQRCVTASRDGLVRLWQWKK